MKILILTCNTGGGHNSTAAALEEQLVQWGHSCVVRDCLELLPPAKARLISEGHVLLYRKAPRLFGLGYKFEENHVPRYLRAQCSACAGELYQAVTELHCDAIICVHVFPAIMVTEAARSRGLNVPGYFVATDYTCSPGVSSSDLELYFIPHPALVDEFIRCGIPQDRLVPSGIPVRRCFTQYVPQAQARRALGLPETGRVAVLICGSMGAGPMEELTQALSRQLTKEDRLVVICGTNQKLRERIIKNCYAPNLRILGFTKKVDQYMDAADLLLTKGGGLTTTEMLNKHLPTLLVNVIPGLEERNIDFMVSHGYARTADSPEALAALAGSLLRQPETLAQWRRTLEKEFSTSAARIICEEICRDFGLEPPAGGSAEGQSAEG